MSPGPPHPTGRRPSPSAKRNSGWVAATFYVRPETRYRLQQVALQAKLADMDGLQDQSDLVEAALQQFLPGAEAVTRAAVARKQTEWAEEQQ
jgi:hypothetical protein